MNITKLTGLIILTLLLTVACTPKENSQNSEVEKIPTDTLWSVRLADSFILRHPGSVTYDDNLPEDRWTYEQGVMLEAMRQMWVKTNDKKYFDFIENNIDQYVSEEGKIRTYNYNDFTFMGTVDFLWER